jgi:uncharacterized protein (DUF3820 family)
VNSLPSCSHCFSSNTYTEPKPPHLGLYCGDCGKWIKWIAQNHPLEAMPFGKHKGTPFNKLSDEYLIWCIQNLSHVSDKLRLALKTEHEKRKARPQ